MKLRPVSTVEALADALRTRILSGDVSPGTQFPEQEISATYGVARPTVREAIAALVHEGILRRERNKSAYVPDFTRDDLDDLLYVRRPLEDLVGAAVAGRRIEEARRALDTMAALPDDAPWAGIVAQHMALHEALARAAGSPRLLRLYLSLSAETRLGVVRLREAYPDRDEMVTEHRELLERLEAGTSQDAAKAAREHLVWRI
uniref:GntR family transcriptional regulator n=1 Tax=Herbidospora sakaeratensis TaxID=564415 RepID=UPI00078514AC|nr:GntR family transcriptional regulator [Herbidospora sakaeratensis]